MAKTLLIVESPAKAKTIQKYLGKSYEVMASKGHIKDLPKSGGVDIENGFKETYVTLTEKGKPEIIKSIIDKAKKADEVLLATDPDREGEAIAWHLMEEVKGVRPDVPVHRVLFNEITKKGVTEGISHPRELDTHLYEAQRTRRVLDRIGGYPLSSLLWKKLAFGLSAGRVQTPALRIIVDRQHEIDAFVPQDYWLIQSRLLGSQKPSFVATLEAVDGEKLQRVGSRPAALEEATAVQYQKLLQKADYRVAKITRREQRRKALAPYITSKLQQDASSRLGFAPKRTMQIAQGLYEGVDIGNGTEGLITYMRTDSTRVSPDAIEACREYVVKTYGKAALSPEPNIFVGKKNQNVQDAHEAIRPTRLDAPPEAVRQYLKDDQFKLYKLIWDRFIASQMAPAVYDQTGVEIEAKSGKQVLSLRASGSVLKEPGWRQVYGASVTLAGDEEASQENSDDADKNMLPELKEGEVLKLEAPPGVTVDHKQTEPPPYYNEASLVKKLEEEGIGRPSTYAEIISKVQARDYVQKVNNRLVPSPLGKLVIEKLVADNFDLADLGFTRKLEEDLDAVSEARGKRLDVLAPFHARLQKQIAKANEQKGKWWPEPELIGETCPECGKGQLIKRWGRNGPFIGCDRYPDCSYTRNVPGAGGEDEAAAALPELTDYNCDLCGAKMMKRSGRNGWFLGCTKYPECKGTRSIPLGVDCPKCGGEIVEVKAKIKGRTGRPFYGCTNYNKAQKCDFKLWQRPVPEPCPKCGAKFLVKAMAKKQPVLKCVNEGCDYMKVVEEKSDSQDAAA